MTIFYQRTTRRSAGGHILKSLADWWTRQRAMDEQTNLVRRQGEREAHPQETGTPEASASGQATSIRRVRLQLARPRNPLARRSVRTAAASAVSKPATKMGILFLGFLVGMGAVGLSPAPGEAQSAPAQTTPVAGAVAESDASASLAPAAPAPTGSAELNRLWQRVREEVLPGRLPEEAQRLVWRRLWQLDPSFRQSDWLDEIGTITAADAGQGSPTGETGALAAAATGKGAPFNRIP